MANGDGNDSGSCPVAGFGTSGTLFIVSFSVYVPVRRLDASFAVYYSWICSRSSGWNGA
jgi:hypothetical protein